MFFVHHETQQTNESLLIDGRRGSAPEGLHLRVWTLKNVLVLLFNHMKSLVTVNGFVCSQPFIRSGAPQGSVLGPLPFLLLLLVWG